MEESTIFPADLPDPNNLMLFVGKSRRSRQERISFPTAPVGPTIPIDGFVNVGVVLMVAKSLDERVTRDDKAGEGPTL